jgi:hypothetical protein
LHQWKEHKITEYDTLYQECLRNYEWWEYDQDAELANYSYVPLVSISKEFWVPSAEEHV